MQLKWTPLRQPGRIARTLRAMTATDRETLLLYAWADLTYEGIVVAMDVPVGTVRSRLNRACRTLRTQLDLEILETENDHGRLVAAPRNACDIGSAPAGTLARGREKVMAKVAPASTAAATTDTHAKGAVRPIRFRRRVLFASAAAALLVCGIVVADVVRPSGPGATAEAAEYLNSAAAATIQSSELVVKPGQYLKVETKAAYSSSVTRADGTTSRGWTPLAVRFTCLPTCPANGCGTVSPACLRRSSVKNLRPKPSGERPQPCQCG